MAFVFDPDNPPTPACHAATIVALADRLVVAWFGGTQEKNPDVGIWVAASRGLDPGGGDWEAPRQVADGDGQACWNPVLADTADGLLLFYKVGKSPGTWHGEMMRSCDGGVRWEAGPALPTGLLGPIKNKPLMLANGDLLCPSSLEVGGWTCHFEILPLAWLAGKGDPKPTRHDVPDPEGFSAIQPTVLRVDGGFEALVRTKAGVIARTQSADGRSWSPLEATPLLNPNSGIDAASLPDGRTVLAHNPVPTPTGRWGGARTPLALAVREADGQWRQAHVLEDTEGEFSYPAIICNEDQVHVAYTWQRRSIRHVAFDWRRYWSVAPATP